MYLFYIWGLNLQMKICIDEESMTSSLFDRYSYGIIGASGNAYSMSTSQIAVF